jgi:hypothetical protein
MKKLTAAVLILLLLAGVSGTAYSAVPGEIIGAVLYTDVVAYIDGYPIRSYNIAWNTYIVAEDLMQYGFSVRWIPEEEKLVIDPEHLGTPDTYSASYVPEKNTHVAGEYAMPYLYTNITTWIGEKQITGYNIGGYTCIWMDDLAAVFAETFIWDPSTITLRMTTRTPALAGTSLLAADARGRVPAAELSVSDAIGSVIEACAGQGGSSASAELRSAFGEENVAYTTDMWRRYAQLFWYEITSSRLTAEGNAEVDVSVSSWNFPAAYDRFAAFYEEQRAAGVPFDKNSVVRLLLQYLGDPQQEIYRRFFTVTVTERGGQLYLADTAANRAFLNGLYGDFFLLLSRTLA